MSGPVQHVYDIIPCVDSPTDPRLDGSPFNVKFGPVDVVSAVNVLSRGKGCHLYQQLRLLVGQQYKVLK